MCLLHGVFQRNLEIKFAALLRTSSRKMHVGVIKRINLSVCLPGPSEGDETRTTTRHFTQTSHFNSQGRTSFFLNRLERVPQSKQMTNERQQVNAPSAAR